jgi:hypothetical protein
MLLLVSLISVGFVLARVARYLELFDLSIERLADLADERRRHVVHLAPWL